MFIRTLTYSKKCKNLVLVLKRKKKYLLFTSTHSRTRWNLSVTRKQMTAQCGTGERGQVGPELWWKCVCFPCCWGHHRPDLYHGLCPAPVRVWLLKAAASQPAHGCADMPGQLYPCREQTHRGAILPMDGLSKNLEQKGRTYNYRCANCHHLPTMLPRVGRDDGDALVPPGAEAGNGTSLPCIIVHTMLVWLPHLS